MPIETAIRRVALAELKLMEKNAHYMDPDEFTRLVNNIKKDGVLTSLPVVYRGTVLSGNHRTQAAIKAGLEEADVIEIVSELSEDEQKAIQLSHNAIKGKDDSNILRELYDSINSLDLKLYSGLTDDDFKITDVEVQTLSFVQPTYEDMVIAFLPEEKTLFIEALEKVGKKAKDRLIVAGRASDFDLVFKAVIDAKSKLNIINTAEALKTIAELALQKLEEEPDESADPVRQGED
ncbi:ParB/RepB/Spo0J family partition protein [Citrobacter sp. Cf140]|uniref:ParB/RepB/Spo0J family partition protein n=1 Tax=Citrobacter TaxID=544 RepID=UPI001A187A3A|nr:ParB/RepB/Spo0J family partition protein [Citrobacter sp. Cf140]MEB1122498.1 ParB/RepB/Spo0J family partition protein [Citrobacter freundii]MDM3100018.1 ParB/RepB/Spo0J family partition protein [Citrobacter sp. Cf140]HAU5659999.1 ParB N-terminal domain-containing protein [Citrobacter freundii]HBV7900233.1 ParB N-terminal domain-containing protein [Citrobacter freundii]HCB2471284.1 ParB N-terminal domain-containing protein [Citrobacter freundii]